MTVKTTDQHKNQVRHSSIKAGNNVHIGDVYYNHPAGRLERSTSRLKAPGRVPWNTIEQLLRNNKIAQVLNQLSRQVPQGSNAYDELLLWQVQWKNMEAERRRGLVTDEDSLVSRNRLVKSLLEGMKEWREEIS